MDRLLTIEEIRASHPYWEDLSDNAVKRMWVILEAQDAKTLKAVGEWLEEKPKDFIRDGTDAFTVEVTVEDIYQLKQGKMP